MGISSIRPFHSTHQPSSQRRCVSKVSSEWTLCFLKSKLISGTCKFIFASLASFFPSCQSFLWAELLSKFPPIQAVIIPLVNPISKGQISQAMDYSTYCKYSSNSIYVGEQQPSPISEGSCHCTHFSVADSTY